MLDFCAVFECNATTLPFVLHPKQSQAIFSCVLFKGSTLCSGLGICYVVVKGCKVVAQVRTSRTLRLTHAFIKVLQCLRDIVIDRRERAVPAPYGPSGITAVELYKGFHLRSLRNIQAFKGKI